MTGLHYPDNLYADHEERKARRTTYQGPLGTHPPTDPVTKPAHYQRAGIETIDYIRATLGDGFEAYCIGNVLKYVSRYREKGGIEDLRKAQVYLGWAIQPKPEGTEVNAPWPVDTTVHEAVANASHGSRYGVDWIYHDDRLGYLPAKPERIPKWDPAWGRPPNCDGQRHPMQAEALRDHDERLAGGEDRL